MKYRRLTEEELIELAEDFKHFLIVNGVHAEEWEEMNKTQVEKAVSLVELFSDTVLQKVYEKVKYLEFRSEDSCLVFNCGKEEMNLISIQVKAESLAKLSTVELIHKALTSQIDQLKFFNSQKSYAQSREEDIHQMFEQGCMLSSEEFWNSLVKGLNIEAVRYN